MQPNQPKQPPITYFVVNPQTFQNVANKLGEMPYSQVANVLQDLISTSKAMFDELPTTPKFKGPGGQVVTDPPVNGAGNETDPPAGDPDKQSESLDTGDKDAGQTESGSAES